MEDFLTSMEPIPRKTMTIFFLIDVSGSMEGSKIGSLNSAMEELIPDLRELSDDNPDAEINIAIMEFSSGFEWKTPNGPISLSQYGDWENLTACGVTDLGDACLELNNKLSKSKGFMKSATGSYAPVIFLMSDGCPTDDFRTGINTLKKNNWFKASLKIALAIGDDADKQVLTDFTGNKELVVTVHNSSQLKKMVKFMAITSSQTQSTSVPVTSLELDEEKHIPVDTSVVESIQAEETMAKSIEDMMVDIDDNDDDDWD